MIPRSLFKRALDAKTRRKSVGRGLVGSILNPPGSAAIASVSSGFPPPGSAGDDVSLPRQARVVVCGGGVVGASVAYHLAARGWSDILLLERGRISCGTTWHAAGLVGCVRSGVMKELTSYSRNLYRWMESNGYPTGFKQCGRIYVAATKDRLVALRRVADECRSQKMKVDEISPKEVKEKFPWLNVDDIQAGFFAPEDGVSSPGDVCVALTKMATDKGVLVRENCGVERVLTSDDGCVVAVETTAGRVQCDHFVLCAGMWSKDLALKTEPKVHIPLQPIEHFYLVTKPIEGVGIMCPVVNDSDSRSYLREWSGGFLVGVFDERSLPAFPKGPPADFHFQLFEENWDHFHKYFKPIIHRFPFLNEVEIRQKTNGPESFTPDTKLFLGETPEVRRFYVATGMNSSGIALAGGVGRCLAEIIVDGRASVDLSELDIKRRFEHQTNRDYLNSRGEEIVGKHYSLSYPKQSQYSTARNVRMSALYGRHKWRGAVFGAINEYEVPLWYPKCHEEIRSKFTFGKPEWFESVREECEQVRRGVGVADVTGLWGAVSISGSTVAASLTNVFYGDLTLPVGGVKKTSMLQQNGQIVCECIVLKREKDEYLLLYPMASQTRTLHWLRLCFPRQSVSVTDVTLKYVFLLLTGAATQNLLEELQVTPIYPDMSNIVTFGDSEHSVLFQHPTMPAPNVFCCIPVENCLSTYDRLLSHGANQLSFYALDTLRIEAGIPWWGNESNSHSTLESMEKQIVHESDISSRVNEAPRTSHTLVSFSLPEMSSESEVWPWGGEPILLGDSAESSGSVTSVAYSHCRNTFVGLGLLSGQAPLKLSDKPNVLIAGKKHPMRIG